jgi:predicted nucleic acid-binding protein
MNVKLVYLDSSSIAKRYIEEEGSQVVDAVYEKAEAGKLGFAFSVWNVGEVLGVLDRYLSRGLLTEDDFKTTLSDFLSESIKMARLGSLQILPITAKSLTESWLLILRHHLYVADALQLSTSKEAGCDLILSADNKLTQIAKKEGMEAVNIETEPERALAYL